LCGGERGEEEQEGGGDERSHGRELCVLFAA
jgi:hypothetical protein